MLFTQKLAEESALINVDFDIEEEEHQFAFESMMNSFEINRIQCEAELIAIEAYKDYNGNMSVLESQFEVIKEEAEKGVFEKVKDWIIKAWNWIKNTAIKFKNWVVGLFSKQKAFINKYKDDETSVTAEIIDFDKAKAAITEFSDEAKDMSEKIKEYYRDLVKGIKFPMNKDDNKHFEYIIDNLSIFGIRHKYESLEKASEFVKNEITKEKKSTTFKMKDFVKSLEDFSKLKNDTKISTLDKHFAKVGMDIQSFFGKNSDKAILGTYDKSKFLFKVGSVATSLLIKIITAFTSSIKTVINTNIEAAQKAYPKKEEAK